MDARADQTKYGRLGKTVPIQFSSSLFNYTRLPVETAYGLTRSTQITETNSRSIYHTPLLTELTRRAYYPVHTHTHTQHIISLHNYFR